MLNIDTGIQGSLVIGMFVTTFHNDFRVIYLKKLIIVAY